MSVTDPRHYDVILAPVITEKATAASEKNQVMFRVAEAITQGMTAARAAGRGPSDTGGGIPEHAELTAVACLMMLERVNYLLSVEVRLPRDEMIDRLSAIIYAAFNSL